MGVQGGRCLSFSFRVVFFGYRVRLVIGQLGYCFFQGAFGFVGIVVGKGEGIRQRRQRREKRRKMGEGQGQSRIWSSCQGFVLERRMYFEFQVECFIRYQGKSRGVESFIFCLEGQSQGWISGQEQVLYLKQLSFFVFGFGIGVWGNKGLRQFLFFYNIFFLWGIELF